MEKSDSYLIRLNPEKFETIPYYNIGDLLINGENVWFISKREYIDRVNFKIKKHNLIDYWDYELTLLNKISEKQNIPEYNLFILIRDKIYKHQTV